MAKTKTPFLSLGSSGTVGGSLTSQKRGGATLLREKPEPTDPYTLAQAYQRWDYIDYAYLWRQQSEAIKQTYRTRASRYHITGFNLWMREHLRDLPDLIGRWHLDEASGAIAYDTSKQGNNGTIIGASPATGLINGCSIFDGLNDRINFGNPAVLQFTNNFTVFLFGALGNGRSDTIGKLIWPGLRRAWVAWRNPGGSITFLWTLDGTAATQHSVTTAAAIDSNFHSIAITFLDGTIQIVLDDILETWVTAWTPIFNNLNDLQIGYSDLSGNWATGRIDELIIYNRVLDQEEILRHSLRRYP